MNWRAAEPERWDGKESTCPLLFLSGTKDTFAERGLLEKVVDRLDSRATLIWTERGDHSLKVGKSGTTTLKTAADEMQKWVGKAL